MMIDRQNTPLSFLPFYRKKESQMQYQQGCDHKEFGMMHLAGFMPSIIFNTRVLSDPTAMSLEIYNNSDDTLHDTIDNTLLTYSTSTDGRGWIRYKFVSKIFTEACGLYYYKLIVQGVSYYSEVFRVMPLSEKKDRFRLVVSSTYDMDDALFQRGYLETISFEGVMDFKEQEITTENFLTGDNLLHQTSKATKGISVLRIFNFPEYLCHAFENMNRHESVILFKMGTDQTWELTPSEIRFETETQDTCFFMGKLKFMHSNTVVDGHDDLIELDLIDV